MILAIDLTARLALCCAELLAPDLETWGAWSSWICELACFLIEWSLGP